MKFTALLASAFVATAVQASEVTLYYCAGSKCTDASVTPDECTELKNPGPLTSIQNTGDCELYRFPGCKGPSTFAPRGSSLLHDAYVSAIVCYEPGFTRNLAPAVQDEEVEVDYCLDGGPCHKEFVAPDDCADLIYPGVLETIQNTADCTLFEHRGCRGRNFVVKRGAHDINELRGKIVGSFRCGEPGLLRTLAPAVQDEPVEVDYCLDGGPCRKEFVAPEDCADLIYPGYLETIQNTADCRLFEHRGCRGRNFVVKRGAHDINELRGKIVGSFVCGEPGLLRTLAPAVQDEEVEVDYCLEGGPCEKEFVAPGECADLIYPGSLKTVQNTADCRLFEHRGCWGRNFVVKRGAHDIKELRGKIVGSFVCGEPGLLRTVAPAVQSEKVALYYCTEKACTNQYVESNECTFLEKPGNLKSIQNTADCELFAYPGCGGHSITVYRGTTLLKNPFAITIKCSKPGFQRNQRPMRRH